MFEGEDDMLNRFAGSPAFQAPEAITGIRGIEGIRGIRGMGCVRG